jgi:photosystem II stability/assembly factor-like uncharacterized protein
MRSAWADSDNSRIHPSTSPRSDDLEKSDQDRRSRSWSCLPLLWCSLGFLWCASIVGGYYFGKLSSSTLESKSSSQEVTNNNASPATTVSATPTSSPTPSVTPSPTPTASVSTPKKWSHIVLSSNGNYILAAQKEGSVWISNNSGTTWTSRLNSELSWATISVSSDGQIMAAAGTALPGETTNMQLSTNYGQTWISIAAVFNPTSIHISPFSKNVIYVGSPSSGIWKSTNTGTTWTNFQRGGVCSWRLGDVGCGSANPPWHIECEANVMLSSAISIIKSISAWSSGDLDFGFTSGGKLILAPGPALTPQDVILWDSGCSSVTATACTASFCFAHCSGGPSVTTAQVAATYRYGASSYTAPLQNDILRYNRPFQGHFITTPSCSLAHVPITATSVANKALTFLTACAGDSTTTLIGVENFQLILGTNNGGSWTTLTSAGTRDFVTASCSNSGVIIVGVERVGRVHFSLDSGNTWSERTP